MERRWLTAKMAGEYLSLNYKTVFDYISRGLIPATKIGGSVRIDKRKLDELLEANSSVSVREQLERK